MKVPTMLMIRPGRAVDRWRHALLDSRRGTRLRTSDRRNGVPRPGRGRLSITAWTAALLIANPAAADLWYEHYANAERALSGEQWELAVTEINEALARKADSGARVRSYGMNVVAYFPYLKLGIAFYHLGQLAAAEQAFETEARLGAIADSETGNADLERYRRLVDEASALAKAEERQRVRRIVAQSLAEAQGLEDDGRLDDAMAALDRALAVAPADADALAAMGNLRARVAEQEQEREREQRLSELVADGRAFLGDGRYREAASVLRQALFLDRSPEIQDLLDAAQRELRGELDADRGAGDQTAVIAAGLREVLELQSAGQLAAALDRLQPVLALAPSNAEALSIQRQLLQASREAEAERARQATIGRLLSDADRYLASGATEDALSAANRVLALDPGNGAALGYIATAYGTISRRLLGTGTRGNIPPAVRFVDLRREQDNGVLAEAVSAPDFRLNGVIIDDSPVVVEFYDDDGAVLEAALNAQPIGDIYITEFSVVSTLSPGQSTFRLVATDSTDLVSSSEYSVVYVRPIYRAPWFYVLLLGAVVLLAALVVWRNYRRRRALRKRGFNPYVAGAPVVGDEMFFGRAELIDRILQTIHNNSLLIYGERRIGKTSIQHQLKKRLREIDDPNFEFHPVYVDLQGTPETRFFQTIAEDIFEELAPVLQGLEPEKAFTEDYSYRDLVRDIRAVLKTLQGRTAKTVKLVLLIDEVDELNAYDPRINQKLRSLFMKNFAENLVAVVSGVEIKKQWEREGSPWYNFFEEIEVEPFGPKEARELIERPIGQVFKIDEGVVERIIALTAGRPYLIQKTCISLVTRLHQRHARRITVADVEAVAGPGGA